MVTGARLVQGIDVHAVEAAVRAAERGTTGEIRVALPRLPVWGDVRRAAERAFGVLKMDRTRHRNGVLIYVAPRRREFAVLGDVGIHARVDSTFWEELAGTLSVAFKAGDVTGGLVRAIAAVGAQLSTQFPSVPGQAVNELPDELARPR
jgi:uncharacterized membrane protein